MTSVLHLSSYRRPNLRVIQSSPFDLEQAYYAQVREWQTLPSVENSLRIWTAYWRFYRARTSEK